MNVEEEVKLVCNLLCDPAGYDVDIAGMLCVRQYEYPIFAVEWEVPEDLYTPGNKKIEVKEFDNPLDAAKFFVEKKT